MHTIKKICKLDYVNNIIFRNIKSYWLQFVFVPLVLNFNKDILTLTVHVVTFGVPHVETGSLHVGRQDVPPFVLVNQDGLCACRALSARWYTPRHEIQIIYKHDDKTLLEIISCLSKNHLFIEADYCFPS